MIDMSESLCLKTIYDLRVDASDEPFRYYIPAYQRGYRWTPTQVTQLLDDIREFTGGRVHNPKSSTACSRSCCARTMTEPTRSWTASNV